MNFALIGAAGYVAPKHMKAIHQTGHQLVAAVDKHDSVGIIDSYFPNAAFFTEMERFDRHIDRMYRGKHADAVDYVSICSPNYLHDAHCRLALRSGAHAICEKPLVINPWNVDQLRELEEETGQKVYNVLQLRLHPAVVALKQAAEAEQAARREAVATADAPAKKEISLTYVTRRGNWYLRSWKGDAAKSGGVAMNIGVHFFDFLLWVYGGVKRSYVHLSEPTRMSGSLELDDAHVRWFLSVDESDLPEATREAGQYAFRSITVDGEEIDLSAGFTDLHTVVYQDILDGGGFGLTAAQPAIELIHQIRNSSPVAAYGSDAHPFIEAGNVRLKRAA